MGGGLKTDINVWTYFMDRPCFHYYCYYYYILELTLGFETNIQANNVRKANKYTPLLQDLSSSYNKVIFINVSMGALGVMGASCDSFLSLLQDLSFDKVTQRRIIMKTINIAIRSTYYIFCQRNKPWNNPELLNIYFLFLLLYI